MKTFSNDFCELAMHTNYVIVVIQEGVDLDLSKALIIKEILEQNYQDREFLMISYRKNRHKIDAQVYKKGLLENMKGLAVVSPFEEEKTVASQEQKLYDKSFVFFDSLDDAESWANHYF
ncbi:hypothetical protein [Aquimarina brevivitae]|uniref:SpoIIAA-like protein n=1 Tax=Aquimarina brevivitae TaxID=323412 RepID=A0A4Q7NUE1_9FLAO|nr:hypothetical protein [Aquimarina brevivitae]RZS90674.1 hypothetical protein EV197_3203 [Aquimarina brevivitae]